MTTTIRNLHEFMALMTPCLWLILIAWCVGWLSLAAWPFVAANRYEKAARQTAEAIERSLLQLGYRQCRYCGEWYRMPRKLEAHERICYLNPKRECPVCGGEGKIVTRYHDGRYVKSVERDCPDCAKAKQYQAGLRRRGRVEHGGWTLGANHRRRCLD
ncbi:MAG: hypothetical protein AB1760_00075 [Pseudomonadota bacterium]